MRNGCSSRSLTRGLNPEVASRGPSSGESRLRPCPPYTSARNAGRYIAIRLCLPSSRSLRCIMHLQRIGAAREAEATGKQAPTTAARQACFPVAPTRSAARRSAQSTQAAATSTGTWTASTLRRRCARRAGRRRVQAMPPATERSMAAALPPFSWRGDQAEGVSSMPTSTTTAPLTAATSPRSSAAGAAARRRATPPTIERPRTWRGRSMVVCVGRTCRSNEFPSARSSALPRAAARA